MGNSVPETGERMELPLFTAILDKIIVETRVRSFGPFIFGDPLTHSELPQFIEAAVRRGIRGIAIPSTLNDIRCDIRELFKQPLERMIISWSGFEFYERFHRGGNLDVVLARMEKIATMNPRPPIEVSFHRYRENLHEVPRAKAFVESLGFIFSPQNAYYMTLDKLILGTAGAGDRNIMRSILNDRNRLARERAGDTHCTLQRKHLFIDARGQVQLCCHLRGPRYNVTDFLSMPLRHIRRMVINHPFCDLCKASGMNILYRDIPTEDGE